MPEVYAEILRLSLSGLTPIRSEAWKIAFETSSFQHFHQTAEGLAAMAEVILLFRLQFRK